MAENTTTQTTDANRFLQGVPDEQEKRTLAEGDNSRREDPIMPSSQEMVPLSGKKILITGGTTGIGRTTAIRLMMDGAHVMIFGRHETTLNDALEDMHALGKGEAHGFIADQAKTDDVERVFREVDEKLGGLDILINNAAISAKSAADESLEDIRYEIESNVTGLIQCTRLAVDRFEKQGSGQIVNVGSMSNTAREKGSDIYVATKAAVNGFSESLRKSLNEKGIRVVLIEPGAVGTNLGGDDVDEEEQRQRIADLELLKAEDIAESIRFALMQPERCDIVRMDIRPRKQSDI